jgi:hypothetical protein
MRLIAAVLMSFLVFSAPGAAGAGDAGRGGLAERLRGLIQKGERRRAADRWFLDELRGLIRQRRRTVGKEIVRDDFRDGNYTRSPKWRVAGGRFNVTRRMGLTSYVAAAPPSKENPPDQKKEGGDITSALLGELLERSLSGKRRRGSADDSERAEIYLRQKISNAYSIRMDIVFRGKDGRLIFGPYDGRRRDRGYRLAFSPGGKRGLAIYRATRRGETLVAEYSQALNVEEGRVHAVEWVRERNGEMTVLLDGRELLKAQDREHRGVFNGFTLVNSGGHFGLLEIVIHGD